MSKNIYLVLHDFTPVGDAALDYAISISSNLSAEIKLVNLVSDKKDVAGSKAKLDAIISKVQNLNGNSITSLARVGSIFEDIALIVKEEKANLIVMGTHGAKGFQKIFGSYAMKVVKSSDVPFFVIQKETKPKNIKKIVVPIDLEKESLQIVNIAGDLAEMYQAEIFVVAEKQDDSLLGQRIKNRILIVRKQYEERNIKCTIELISGKGSYSEKIMTYAVDNSADLVAIAYHSASILPFDTFAQSLLMNNEFLPCVILNSKPASSVSF